MRLTEIEYTMHCPKCDITHSDAVRHNFCYLCGGSPEVTERVCDAFTPELYEQGLFRGKGRQEEKTLG